MLPCTSVVGDNENNNIGTSSRNVVQVIRLPRELTGPIECIRINNIDENLNEYATL